MNKTVIDIIPEEHFLAFVDCVGKTVDGKYIYRFDFTRASDIVWGDAWNATPAGIIPKLEPDVKTLSISGQVLSKHRYQIAKENTCFSMQDCIDGILPLLFDEPYSDDLMILRFGIGMPEVLSILEEHGLELTDIKDVNAEQDEKVIENLISTIKEKENKGDSDEE